MSTFYDPTFYDKLDILRRRLGDTIKDNVLEYFLKQSNGDINRCIALLKDDGWFSPRLTNNLPPERSVQLQQSNRPTPTTAQHVGTSVRPTDHTPHHKGSATLPRTILPSTSPVLVPRRDHFVPEFPMELDHNMEFLSSHQIGPSPLKVSPPPFPKEGPTGFQPVPQNLLGPQVSTPYHHPNHSPPGNHHHPSSHIPASMPAHPSSSGSKQSPLGPNPIPYGHQYQSGALSSSFDQPDASTSYVSKYVSILNITSIINLIFGDDGDILSDHPMLLSDPNSPIYHITVNSFTTPVHLTYTSMSRICDWKLPQQYNSPEAVV